MPRNNLENHQLAQASHAYSGMGCFLALLLHHHNGAEMFFYY